MAARIQISSAASGSPVAFTLSSNPNEYFAEDSPDQATFQVLHGANIIHKKSFDNRARSFVWKGNFVTDTFIAPIDTYFRSIEGKIRYFNFLDMDDINKRWPSSDTWKKLRIIGIEAVYKSGGRLQYSSFKLMVQPEE